MLPYRDKRECIPPNIKKRRIKKIITYLSFILYIEEREQNLKNRKGSNRNTII